ncbi:MAG TPA: radical SAM family heme chaperone HemW [Bacteroidia bacterium]|nr:radical SAM family heme chaperone HemW [Bacteroidia bacterium]
MAGIYIHIPFCKKACHYCDFHFSTSLSNKEALVDSLCTEIALRKDYLNKKELSTIYIGGGTPSLLSLEDLKKVFNTVRQYYTVLPDAEITLEANPDDLTPKKVEELVKAGINRLSIGIQSFFDEHLVLMNRTHTSIQAIEAVKQAQKAGIENISIDLIYGLPGLTLEKWNENLQQAFTLSVPHISAYCLTVEKRTALHHMVKEKQIILPDEPIVTEQFNMLVSETAKNGFIHYEISNFCKEGMYSKHNSSYWKNEHYLGIGPSAHSFDEDSRQWNISNNALYIKALENKEPYFEKEMLTEADKFNEYVMTRLRTIWGIDLGFVRNNFGESILESFLQESKHYVDSGYIQHTNENITLTHKGKLIADRIASDLFI